jgi:L-ribulose-5-phosphate 4-epimerase
MILTESIEQRRASQAAARDLVLAARILVRNHLDSGPFGNLSVRIPGTSLYWQNPAGVFFDQLTTDDLVLLDLEGRIHEGRRAAHQGDYIHQQILRHRPDVGAIVHTHSHSTVMLCVLGRQIEPFSQIGASLHGDQGVYDGFSGPVRDFEEGEAIARALGDKSLVIARAHGIFATGATLPAALWDMILADWAAREHLHALQLGLAAAPPLRPQDYEKSRVELRAGMYAAIWDNELRRLHKEHPELA